MAERALGRVEDERCPGHGRDGRGFEGAADGRRKTRPGGVDARAMGRFVAALEKGAHVLDAARAAGRHASSFYRHRRRCAPFAEAWDEAVAKSDAPLLIAAGNGRKLQKRKSRRIRFTDARKEAFLAHFAATCDQAAAAAEAGVSTDTVAEHLHRDRAFAEAWQTALETGYRALEAELLGRVRAALRIEPKPEATAAIDFERGLKLLQQWKRPGTVRARSVAHGRLKRWSFDDAMVALEKQLAALGYRVDDPAADAAGAG